VKHPHALRTGNNVRRRLKGICQRRFAGGASDAVSRVIDYDNTALPVSYGAPFTRASVHLRGGFM
jgi:hypothetical protein